MKIEPILFSILLISLSCTSHVLQSEGDDAILCGAYTEQRDPSSEEIALFHSVMGEKIFSPINVATQVVAGLNYRFRCRYDDGSENAPAYCLVTIYQPLQGKPVLSGIQDEKGGPEMKIVVDDEGNVGRYIGEDKAFYHASIQDDYWIEKSKSRIEIVKACEGRGILTLRKPGSRDVYHSPDTDSGSVGTMVYEQGYVPEVYKCLGYINGWFLAEVDGAAGFINKEVVEWDAINSF